MAWTSYSKLWVIGSLATGLQIAFHVGSITDRYRALGWEAARVRPIGSPGHVYVLTVALWKWRFQLDILRRG